MSAPHAAPEANVSRGTLVQATAGTDARAFVRQVREAVDERLSVHFAAAERRARAAGEHPAAIAGALEALVRRGGKRLRAALTLAAHHACGGEAGEQALLDAGCAWELLQAYFLIHDDWMDGDTMRRGGPAVHVALAAHHDGREQLGAAAAILAGDLACALAHRVLLEAAAPPEVLHEATLWFARTHEEVVLGQAIDLPLGGGDTAAVERLHDLTTGSYTVRGPLLLGAIFARASGEARAALERFARPIGIAFQLRDDLLGAFGDTIETGKPVGSDVRSGKHTTLLAEARRLSSSSERVRLDAISEASRVTAMSDDDVRFVLDLFESNGARRAVETRIVALVDEGRAALNHPALSSSGGELLGGLAALLAHRSA